MVQGKPSSKLAANQLRWRCPLDYLPFETTEELSPYTGIVGQDRAVEAVKIGLALDEEGYNLFVTGLIGADRLSVIEQLLEQTRNPNDQTPDDICCVNNFKDPDTPKIIYLAAGQGADLRKDIKEFIEASKETIPQVFESEEYKSRRKTITESLRNQQRESITAFEKKVEAENFRVVRSRRALLTARRFCRWSWETQCLWNRLNLSLKKENTRKKPMIGSTKNTRSSPARWKKSLPISTKRKRISMKK